MHALALESCRPLQDMARRRPGAASGIARPMLDATSRATSRGLTSGSNSGKTSEHVAVECQSVDTHHPRLHRLSDAADRGVAGRRPA